MEEKINYGVRPNEPIVETAYVAGINSPLAAEAVNPSGDWTKYLVTKEWQKDPNTLNSDKMECVTQSHHNAIEIKMYFDHLTGRMPQAHWDWLKANGYIDSNGFPNFNERLSAISNGTTKDGNWLYNVAEDGRKVGLFPYWIVPDDKSLAWDVYYDKKLLTPERLAIGQEFLKRFGLNYEWVNILQLSEHITQAPLQIVKPGHAITEITKPDPLKYFDHYNPFIKSLAAKYVVSAMKHLITYKEINQETMKLIQDNGTVYLQAGVNNKVKMGIADPETLALFGDEPVIDGTATGTEHTISKGFIIHKK